MTETTVAVKCDVLWSYSAVVCMCGRGFQGRDARRMHQHFVRHARRCSSSKRAKRQIAAWRRAHPSERPEVLSYDAGSHMNKITLGWSRSDATA